MSNTHTCIHGTTRLTHMVLLLVATTCLLATGYTCNKIDLQKTHLSPHALHHLHDLRHLHALHLLHGVHCSNFLRGLHVLHSFLLSFAFVAFIGLRYA